MKNLEILLIDIFYLPNVKKNKWFASEKLFEYLIIFLFMKIIRLYNQILLSMNGWFIYYFH